MLVSPREINYLNNPCSGMDFFILLKICPHLCLHIDMYSQHAQAGGGNLSSSGLLTAVAQGQMRNFPWDVFHFKNRIKKKKKSVGHGACEQLWASSSSSLPNTHMHVPALCTKCLAVCWECLHGNSSTWGPWARALVV